MGFTLESSSVMCPSHAGSMNPAVLWMRSPSRPRLLLPSTRDTTSSERRMRSRVEPSTNSPGWRMNASVSATSTSSVMSSRGLARSMYAWRLERKTRKNRSRRMSTLAGCTQDGSKGSMPMRPDAIAARMSRSESTTAAKYGVAAAREREDRLAQFRPCTDDMVGALDASAREPPEDLDRARPGGPSHRDVRVRIADDDAFVRLALEARHRVLREVRRRLRPRHRIAAQVHVDLARDAEATQDALAVRGALAGDGRLVQSGLVEGVQRLARTFIELGHGNDLAVVDLAVLHPIAVCEIRRQIWPRDTKDVFEGEASHCSDALERERRSAMRFDDAIRRIDDEAHAVGERAVQIPENSADAHAVADSEIGTAGPAAARGSRSRVGLPAANARSSFLCRRGPSTLARENPAGRVTRGALLRSARATTARDRGCWFDGQRGLLGELTIAHFLSATDQRLEFVVERVGILQSRIHDLESQITHGVRLFEALEDHFADALGSHLGRTALSDGRLDVIDQSIDGFGGELFRSSLADGARELATVELLARPVPLYDLDAGRLGTLARSESLAARVAGSPPADG